MSVESVAEFLVKVDENEALRKELNDALQGESEQGAVMSAVAARHGLEFTSADFDELISTVISAEEASLSETELESVAGGTQPRALSLPVSYVKFTSNHRLQNVRLQRGLVFIC
jgi:predicted ribosomally synthesized peptide with nif11-like leader